MLYVHMDRVADARLLWARAWPRIVARGDEYTTDMVRRAMKAVLEEKGLPTKEWLA